MIIIPVDSWLLLERSETSSQPEMYNDRGLYSMCIQYIHTVDTYAVYVLYTVYVNPLQQANVVLVKTKEAAYLVELATEKHKF